MRRALLLSALSVIVSFTALADPPAPAQKEISDAELACRSRFKLELANLGRLNGLLKLTDTQKPLFEAWRKASIGIWESTPCPPPPTGLNMPVPERLQNQITMVSATLEGLRKELPAAKALYAALTPEQRAIFDGPIKLAAPPPGAPPPSVAPNPATH